jgi:excisionase family DNA binding protein
MPKHTTSGAEQPPRRLAYSIIEAAKAVGISRSSIYVEIAEGRLRVRKIGRRSVVFDADLKAWMTALPVKTSA